MSKLKPVCVKQTARAFTLAYFGSVGGFFVWFFKINDVPQVSTWDLNCEKTCEC